MKVTSDRDHFTKHGLHLNRKGKEQDAKTTVNSIKEIFKLQKKGPIKMSWKDEQNLEGANTVNNNVDKDDDLIIHEQQANRDQEQKDDKLLSKQARRLPTTRRFFMAGHQHKSIISQDIETSFSVFHQNIRGLLNKSEELISSLSPDFPQVLCLTEHHLKYFEIDFLYMNQYKLGA